MEAAKRLVEPVARGQKYNDIVAFAVFFLFRHCVEWTLKACIITKTRLKRAMEGLDAQKLKCTHDLNSLLSQLKVLSGPKEEFLSDAIQTKIRLIGEFDTKSDRFRYLFDKNGKTLINDQMLIGMKNTKKTIEEISSGLDELAERLGFAEDSVMDWLWRI